MQMGQIMTSLRPEYNEKIHLMTALAPVVYINNMVGFPKLIAPFQRILKVSSGFLHTNGFMRYKRITITSLN